jgi:Cytochrome C'
MDLFNKEFKTKRAIPAVLIVALLGGSLAVRKAAAQSARSAAAPKGPASSAYAPETTLAQLMKGILFPASNVVFAAQNTNPADVPPAKDPSVATDPLQNTYGKWEAVENSGLAIAEAANLLLIPGRKCSNGRNAPLSNPDWNKLVDGLREAGRKVYAAAKAKDQDKILDAADSMTTACSNCHEKYREKPTPADRCM